LKPDERSVEEKLAIVLSLLKGESNAGRFPLGLGHAQHACAERCRSGTTEKGHNKGRERFLEGGKAALKGRQAEAQGARPLKEALAEAVW